MTHSLIYTRAAWHEGILYYELRPGKVVRVGPGGWTCEANPPVLFRRYVNLKPLPDPEAGGSLDVLTPFEVSEHDEVVRVRVSLWQSARGELPAEPDDTYGRHPGHHVVGIDRRTIPPTA